MTAKSSSDQAESLPDFAWKGLAGLLAYAALSMWVGGRWAWSAAQIGTFAGLAGWAVTQWRRAWPVKWHVWLAPLGFASVWGLIQLAAERTVYRWGTWNAVLTWATWLALFFLALQAFGEARARHWFLRFSVYFGGGLSILAAVQMATSRGKVFWLFASGYSDFVLGPFVNRNEYAAFLEMILPMALWQGLRGRNRMSCLVFAAAIFASVTASASRAGTVLMLVEMAVILVLASRRGVAQTAVLRGLVVFVALALIFAAVAGWQVLGGRLRERDPWMGRRELMRSSAAMFEERPLMGWGLGNWPRAYPRYALFDDGTYVNQAHNDWVQWAVEGGLPFVAALGLLAMAAIPAAIRSVWGIGLISVWVHALVEYPLQQRPTLGAWLFVLLGLLAREGYAGEGRNRA